jgi:hypothetical protein
LAGLQDSGRREDIILKKLDYYREGHSEKHLRDIAEIFRISGSRLDLDYLREWVARLGLDEEWRTMEEVLPASEGGSRPGE